MSLFQCEECGCRENTATSGYWFREEDGNPCQGRKLCSACDPSIAEWHGNFERIFLPKGKFVTGVMGTLVHIDNGDTEYKKYRLPR